MSQFTAHTLMPLISALPESERHVLADMLNKLNKPRPKRRKKDIYDKVGDIYRPENLEMLVTDIIHGNSKK